MEKKSQIIRVQLLVSFILFFFFSLITKKKKKEKKKEKSIRVQLDSYKH